MTSDRLLRAADLLLWVVVVAAAIVGVATVLAFVAGDGAVTLKYLLFVVGFLMFGAGSVGIQPEGFRKRAGPETNGGVGESRVPSLGSLSADSDSEHGFEARIQQLPPLRDERLPLDDRVSRDWKLFVASLAVLCVSLLLEVGLGVTAA